MASVAILFISKVLGIVREMALAYSFGISYIVDAYTVSIAVPGVIFGIYASGFSQSYIPACMAIRPDERNKFFSSTMTILTVVSLLVAVGCFWGSENLADIMAPGVSLRTRELIIYFIRGISFMLPFPLPAGRISLSIASLYASIIFSIISLIFTYLGLKLGKKLNLLIGKVATLIGGISLILFGIIYIVK